MSMTKKITVTTKGKDSVLVSINSEGENIIKGMLKELVEKKYITIEKIKSEKEDNTAVENKTMEEDIEQISNVEKNTQVDCVQTPNGEKTEGGNLEMDCDPTIGYRYISTDISNISNISIDKIDKIDKTIVATETESIHTITRDLIKREYLDSEDTEIYKYNNLFKRLLKEGHKFKKIVTIVHYVVAHVIKKKFRDENGEIIRNKFGYLKKSISNNIAKLDSLEVEWDNESGWFSEQKQPNYDETACELWS